MRRWVLDGVTARQAVILLEVVERHRGDDDARAFFLKLRRTLADMLAGRPVRPWRLERAQRFFEDVAGTCLRKVHDSRGGCF